MACMSANVRPMGGMLPAPRAPPRPLKPPLPPPRPRPPPRPLDIFYKGGDILDARDVDQKQLHSKRLTELRKLKLRSLISPSLVSPCVAPLPLPPLPPILVFQGQQQHLPSPINSRRVSYNLCNNGQIFGRGWC